MVSSGGSIPNRDLAPSTGESAILFAYADKVFMSELPYSKFPKHEWIQFSLSLAHLEVSSMFPQAAPIGQLLVPDLSQLDPTFVAVADAAVIEIKGRAYERFYSSTSLEPGQITSFSDLSNWHRQVAMRGGNVLAACDANAKTITASFVNDLRSSSDYAVFLADPRSAQPAEHYDSAPTSKKALEADLKAAGSSASKTEVIEEVRDQRQSPSRRANGGIPLRFENKPGRGRSTVLPVRAKEPKAMALAE